MFFAALRDNLLLANPAADTETLQQVIKDTGHAACMDRMPEGINTVIGPRGMTIAGGERRRIAIARALLKEAPVLLLDEPTRGLDAISARRVMDFLVKQSGDKSLLVITHHLTGLEAMDEIIVLDRGRVTERGRWEDLMAQKDLFYQLRRSELDQITDSCGLQ